VLGTEPSSLSRTRSSLSREPPEPPAVKPYRKRLLPWAGAQNLQGSQTAPGLCFAKPGRHVNVQYLLTKQTPIPESQTMFSRIRSIIPTDARNYALLTHTHTLDAAALPRTSFA